MLVRSLALCLWPSKLCSPCFQVFLQAIIELDCRNLLFESGFFSWALPDSFLNAGRELCSHLDNARDHSLAVVINYRIFIVEIVAWVDLEFGLWPSIRGWFLARFVVRIFKFDGFVFVWVIVHAAFLLWEAEGLDLYFSCVYSSEWRFQAFLNWVLHIILLSLRN